MQHGFISADVLPATRPSGECTEGNSTRRNHRSVLVLLSSTQGTLLPLCRLHNANTTASITHDHYSSMQEVMLLYIFVTFSSQIYNIEYYCDHCFNSRFLGELGLGGFFLFGITPSVLEEYHWDSEIGWHRLLWAGYPFLHLNNCVRALNKVRY